MGSETTDVLLSKVSYLEAVIAELQAEKASYWKSSKLPQPPMLDLETFGSLSPSTATQIMTTQFVDTETGYYNAEDPLSVFLRGDSIAIQSPSSNNIQMVPLPIVNYNSMARSVAENTAKDMLKYHLLSISLSFFVGACADERNQPIKPACRSDLSDALLRAICFHSTFISNHPALFNGSAPTFQQRLKVAKCMYEYQPMEFIPTNFKSNQHMCDDIRAILTTCMTEFGIGNGSRAIELISRSFQMVRSFGFLNAKTFGQNSSGKIRVLDELSNCNLEFKTVLHDGSLTDQERGERILLICYLLGVDVYHSIASGQGFILNDSDIPDTNFKNTGCYSKNSIQLNSSSKYTIWDNTPFASVFDSVKMSSMKDLPVDALYLAQTALRCLKFFRKIISWSRSQKFNVEGKPDPVQMVFHKANLKMQHELSKATIIDGNLMVLSVDISPFLYENPDSDIPPKFFEGVAVDFSATDFLCKLCYLHYPTSSNFSLKFPVTVGGTATHNSRQILFAAARAFYWIIRKSNISSNQDDLSAHSLPSPAISTATFGLKAFVVASSAASAFQVVAHPDTAQTEALFCYLLYIQKSLKQIGKIWPVCNHLYLKLDKLLQDYPQK